MYVVGPSGDKSGLGIGRARAGPRVLNSIHTPIQQRPVNRGGAHDGVPAVADLGLSMNV